MSGGFASSGFEIAHVLDTRAYPTARRSRAGPPPSTQLPGFDPLAARLAPIRSRNTAFVVDQTLARALLALGPFVGPGLLKRLDLTHSNLTETGVFAHFNIFVNSSPYTTATGLALTALPAGSPIFDAASAMGAGSVYADEGGIANRGQAINGHRFVLDHYVPDTQFFLGLVIRNPVNAAGSYSGNLLVYEGILPSDFPNILG